MGSRQYDVRANPKKDTYFSLASYLIQLIVMDIHYQMFYVLNFPFEFLPILACDLGSIDQAINDSSLRVLGIVGLEV
jgi:hypothetical protein